MAISRAWRGIIRSVAAACALLFTGCTGAQSALDPAGREAEHLSGIFWTMTIGALLIWVATIALALYVARLRAEPQSPRRAMQLVIWGGAIVPSVVLLALLIYGLKPIPALLARAPEGSLKIIVSGEQWWWRVRYQMPGAPAIELANEIRLPVGEQVQFQLESPDVIHSFWIPPLAGKMDMIPGRVTYLAMTPTRTGVFRGACAEYCGTSHALMAFDVVVEERAAFDRWIAGQAQRAAAPSEPTAVRGERAFLAHGCSACHTINGTAAAGRIGPDLTHVGSRLTLAAGTIPNERDSFHRWISRTEEVKPGVLMPSFGMLSPEDLQAISAYLEGLK